ncbi:HAD family hydrolase [Roseisalinus antarcticus]|uniref:Phosphorylated carbohydrates phosphatase n=1 Tax=Roseisalinus antarcticus TaxID=254357 RepID=A0A1Y5RDQ0_9RHOB|nr:HAD-IA family hydrolase [Roseisalinus antarcticus]SLN14225.1 Phosphorylated carbohydrates phosphatase [Roseisalinus antarcticus]
MSPALLFDLDGTMLETDAIHRAVFTDMLAPRGIAVDEAFYMEHIHGRLNADFFAEWLPDEADPEALSEAKEAEFRRRLPHPFPAMAGLHDLLDRATAAGLPIAVVTNAMRPNAEAMLRAIDARDHFEVIVIGEECPRAKPHPDPYLQAIEALGVAPEQTIAFEDSPSGIRAARAAGAFAIGIRSSLSDAALRAAGAHRTLSDFTDPALADILRRFKGVPA